jgi:hypothetical protein
MIKRVFTTFLTVSLVMMSLPTQAAPSGTISGTFCDAVKDGNTVKITAGGTYNAYNTSKNDYQINGFRIDLRNNGGQQLRSTGLVSISPTDTYTAIKSWTIPYKEASSLKDMKMFFYNGGAKKAESVWINCSWT